MLPVETQEVEKRKRLKWLANIRVFLSEVKQELKMISFPSWREVRAQTVIVLIVIFVLSAYVLVLDLICQKYLDPIMFRHQ